MSNNKWGLETMPKTICAIDASTNSLAFALFDTQQKTLESIGKIYFEGRFDQVDNKISELDKPLVFCGEFGYEHSHQLDFLAFDCLVFMETKRQLSENLPNAFCCFFRH